MTNLAPHRSTISILHDDPLLSAGLAAALRTIPTFDVFEDRAEAASTAADIVVADYRHALVLAENNDKAAGEPLMGARILALTTNDREADILRAIQAGVHGYLLVGGPISELIEAVTKLASGGLFLCQHVAQRIAYSMSCSPLTHRENDVLRLVVAGNSNKIIARRLGIEIGTVKSHMSTIMSKLGANSRVQVVSVAAERGLLGGIDSPMDKPIRGRVAMVQAESLAC